MWLYPYFISAQHASGQLQPGTTGDDANPHNSFFFLQFTLWSGKENTVKQ